MGGMGGKVAERAGRGRGQETFRPLRGTLHCTVVLTKLEYRFAHVSQIHSREIREWPTPYR